MEDRFIRVKADSGIDAGKEVHLSVAQIEAVAARGDSATNIWSVSGNLYFIEKPRQLVLKHLGFDVKDLW